jgi:hypothetical protein
LERLWFLEGFGLFTSVDADASTALSGYGVISNEVGRCKSCFLCSLVGSSTHPRRRRNCVCF